MEETTSSFSFSDFPEDVQLCILSFLEPSHISVFAATSKRYVSICRDDQRLWLAMCDRRWGAYTRITKWAKNAPKISYKRLYKTLQEYETLIGFWRRCSAPSQLQHAVGPGTAANLVLFEWGPFYVSGFRVLPLERGTYKVQKVPFLLMGVNSKGEAVNYLDPEGGIMEFSGDLEDMRVLGSGLIPVSVSFIGQSHIVVEEIVGLVKNSSFSPESEGKRVMGRVSSSNDMREEEIEEVYGSPGTNWTMLEIYQHLANPTRSPGGNGNGAWRRQRRREREKLVKKKLESEHFVKIVDCFPTPARPLQGLWKGISEDMSLEFYLVGYDDIGGIICRRIWDSSSSSSGYNPVFWTSDTMFTEYPFCAEEECIYETRIHLQSLAEDDHSHDHLLPSEIGAVSRMLYITSRCDLVIPDLAGTNLNPQQVQGRVWQYKNGTFGFGFLGSNYIVDLKHIAQDGHLLDTVNRSDG